MMDKETKLEGRKPKTKTKSPWVKWWVIGFIGTVLILSLFALILVWKFTPITLN